MSRGVIYGAGGFGRELVRPVRAVRPDAEIVFASDTPSEVGTFVQGLPVIHPKHFKADDLCVLAAGNAPARRSMAQRCPGFLRLVAPTAIVNDDIDLPEGAVSATSR